MATQDCDKFDKIKNKDNRDFKLAIPLHENDPSYAKDISNDVSISFLDSAFNFFVELEKSAFKSVVYSHGKGLELKHPAGLMNFSVPNIQVIETAARRTRISESDKNNIAGYKVSFTSPTNQLDSSIIKIGYDIRRFLPLIKKVPEIVPIFNNYGTNYQQIRESLLKYLEESKDGDQFDYSKFPFCKRPNLEDFTLDITNSNSNERITAQNYLLYQKPGFIPIIPCPKIISDEEIANLSEIEANIKKSEVIEKLNIHMFHCAKGSGVSKDAKGERSSSKAREVVEKFAENIREEFILREFNHIKAVAPHVTSFMKEINYEWKIIDLFEELKYGFFETTLSNNNIRGIFLHLIKTAVN
ncbi:5935_t:CDS:2 [Rhizophagus irregularis]|nr:5935_t:CDS:2 [Rhizophagus irregularis]